MDLSDRIQKLRKEKGISQDQLANETGVSRQAVSKWESGQSLPDLNKIIALSDYFNVPTDYLLKGTENKSDTNATASRILYVASTLFIALGIISAFANWYENQNMEDVLGSFILHAAGIASYFIGTVLSETKASAMAQWLNLMMLIFIPLSLLITVLCDGLPAPYPNDILTAALFGITYIVISILSYILLKRS